MRSDPTVTSGRRLLALVVSALLLGAATSRAAEPLPPAPAAHHVAAPVAAPR